MISYQNSASPATYARVMTSLHPIRAFIPTETIDTMPRVSNVPLPLVIGLDPAATEWY